MEELHWLGIEMMEVVVAWVTGRQRCGPTHTGVCGNSLARHHLSASDQFRLVWLPLEGPRMVGGLCSAGRKPGLDVGVLDGHGQVVRERGSGRAAARLLLQVARRKDQGQVGPGGGRLGFGIPPTGAACGPATQSDVTSRPATHIVVVSGRLATSEVQAAKVGTIGPKLR